MDVTALRVHAATLPEGTRPGLWADTAAKLLLMAANELEVSEACNKAKTECLAEIKVAMDRLTGVNTAV